MKLYSTHCPRCRVIEKKLLTRGIDFELIDNNDEVTKFGEEHGINSAPMLVLDDGTILGFSEANAYINS